MEQNTVSNEEQKIACIEVKVHGKEGCNTKATSSNEHLHNSMQWNMVNVHLYAVIIMFTGHPEWSPVETNNGLTIASFDQLVTHQLVRIVWDEQRCIRAR